MFFYIFNDNKKIKNKLRRIQVFNNFLSINLLQVIMETKIKCF